MVQSDKINKQTYNKLVKLLDKYTGNTVFENWTRKIDKEFKDLKDDMAVVNIDEFNTEMTISVSRNLLEKNWEYITNTIKHEVIHGMVTLLTYPHKELVTALLNVYYKIIDYNEELIVNEITKIK